MLEVLCSADLPDGNAPSVVDQRYHCAGVIWDDKDDIGNNPSALSSRLDVFNQTEWQDPEAHAIWQAWAAREVLALGMLATDAGIKIEPILQECKWLEEIAPLPMASAMTAQKWKELVENVVVVGFWLPVLDGNTAKRLRVSVVVERPDKTIPDWLQTIDTTSALSESMELAKSALKQTGIQNKWAIVVESMETTAASAPRDLFLSGKSGSLGLVLAVWSAVEAMQGRYRSAQELEFKTAVTGEIDTGKNNVVHKVEGFDQKLKACSTLRQIIFAKSEEHGLVQEDSTSAKRRQADTLEDAKTTLDDRYDLLNAPVNLPSRLDWMICAVSEQLIPLLQAFCDARPKKAILFYSDKTKPKAEKLQAFLEKSKSGFGYTAEDIKLAPVAHDDFANAINDLKQGCAEINGHNVAVNITGGNKIMSMALQRFAQDQDWPLIYKEIGQKHRAYMVVRWERKESGEKEPRVAGEVILERGADADSFDPLLWIELQSNWSLKDQNELLSLSGKLHPEDSRWQLLDENFLTQNLRANDGPIKIKASGDRLEYLVGMALLSLGIKHVRKGVKLGKDQTTSDTTAWVDQEHDLVFISNSKLWLVDCKDRESVREKAQRCFDGIMQTVGHLIKEYQRDNFYKIVSDLEQSEREVLVRDAWNAKALGLSTQVLVVRRATLSPVAEGFIKATNMKRIEDVFAKKSLPQTLMLTLGLNKNKNVSEK